MNTNFEKTDKKKKKENSADCKSPKLATMCILIFLKFGSCKEEENRGKM